MITREKERKEKKIKELEEKRRRFGDMATLCTKIGMPKYREIKRNERAFFLAIFPPTSVTGNARRVKVSVRFTVCAISVYGCVLVYECSGIHIHAV